MKLSDLYYSSEKYNHSSGYGDKGTAHTYIPIYERLFEPIKNNNLKILEIGIMHGHSLRLWEDYFKDSIIYAIDINQNCVNYQSPKSKVIIGDATREDIINHLDNNTFDIIIDDGSHRLEDQFNSWKLLYPLLNTGGIYIIEDVLDIDSSRKIFESLNPAEIIDNRKLKNEQTDVMVIFKK
jgi:hypothetical protein